MTGKEIQPLSELSDKELGDAVKAAEATGGVRPGHGQAAQAEQERRENAPGKFLRGWR